MNLMFPRLAARPVAPALICLFLLNIAASAAELVTRNFAVELNATLSLNPPEITLAWVGDQYARSYKINRKLLNETAWKQIGTADGPATKFVDKQVSPGVGYEYQVIREGSLGYTGYGYIYAGINLPLVESRGRIILVVEETAGEALSADLKRFEFDLIGDGWTVARTTARRADKPPEVKAKIQALYAQSPADTVALLLFGNVPVPYSGNITPDEHDNHRGAWPADVYYADMDGVWTDQTVTSTDAERTRNHNLPGDGKFDQDQPPSRLELQVGRVDLSNMTCFLNKNPSRTEIDLLRGYLEKNHRFRHRQIVAAPRAMIFDRIGVRQPEALAASAWRNFAPFVGRDIQVIDAAQYFDNASTNTYLWSGVAAGGGYNHADWVGASDSFALHDVNVVFATFVGSYYGDWDNESNFLRAGLGARGFLLATAYSGKPQWLFHPMALGHTIGASAKLTQENGLTGSYLPVMPGNGQVHIALHGDPTLRAHPVDPPKNLRARVEGANLVLQWNASGAERLQGYNVYKAATPAGPYQRINAALLTGTEFAISNYSAGDTFMVRAIANTESPSGTYFNASQGVFYPNPISEVFNELPAAPTNLVVTKVTPSSVALRWVNNSVNATAFIIERQGPGERSFREIARANGDADTFADSALPQPGTYSYRVAAANAAGFSQYSNTATAATRPASASFMLEDRVTQGAWMGAYGREGRVVPSLDERLPAFATLSVSNTFLYRTALVSDPRGPQVTGYLQRSANCWVASAPFGFSLNFTDEAAHQVAIYTASFARLNPVSKLQVFDAVTGKLLDERAMTAVNEGVYYVYEIRGQVHIKVVPPSIYEQAEVYGIFIDPLVVAPVRIDPGGGMFNGKTAVTLSSPTPGAEIYYTLDGSTPTRSSTRYTAPFWLTTSSRVLALAFKEGLGESGVAEAWFTSQTINNVGFLKWDESTSGSWAGKYGTEGYLFPGGLQNKPIFAEVSFAGASEWLWQETTTDPRALQMDRTGQRRRASGWYTADSFVVDLGIFDARSHSIGFYFVDWDRLGREQLVEVIDANGSPSQSFLLTNFQDGRYLFINLQGNAKLRVTRKKGSNAVLNGIFFDPAPEELSDPKPLVMSSAGVAGGYFSFKVEGRAGSNFCIDGSNDLNTWSCLATNLLRTTVSTFQPAAGPKNTFYRAHYVP